MSVLEVVVDVSGFACVVQGVDDLSWESRTGCLLLVDRTRG